MPETTAQKHIRIYDTLKASRATIEAYWQDLMYYCLPRKAYITRIKNQGDRLPTDIYDSTAIRSTSYFAAGMQAYMSSPQTRWFSIGLKDRNLMLQKSILKYLRDSEDALYSAINNSNFYQEDVEGYLDLASIGTNALYAEEDIKEDVRFDSFPIENIVLAADAQNRVNHAYLEFEYTADQAIGKFGTNAAGEHVRECFAKSDYTTKFKYLFCIVPRDVYDASKKDAKNMPYASIWIDRKRIQVVMEKGYKEFPIFVSRFTKGKFDVYGYSPAMNVLADIKMVNAMAQTNILGAQMAVLPPLEIPDEAFIRPFNFNPNGKNIRAAGFPNEHITPIVTGANVPIGIDFLKQIQMTIQQAFYNDLFVNVEQIGTMTATEVTIRNNQRMQLLGSAVGNIMREKLSPVIERVYSILARNNKLPPLPPELNGQEYIIEYISPLARAQKSLEMQNLQQAISIIASFGQVNPDVLDKIDFDEAVDYVAEITNITPKIIRDDAEVQAIREGRAQQNAMAQQMAFMQQGTEMVAKGAEADKTIAESQQVALPAGGK